MYNKSLHADRQGRAADYFVMKQNQTDIERIEIKLDMIIQHFNIGQTPRRSAKEIDDLAKLERAGKRGAEAGNK